MTWYKNTWTHSCRWSPTGARGSLKILENILNPVRNLTAFQWQWCSAFSQARCVSLQSSWSSLRRTAGSQAGGRTCPLTPGTSTLSSCSSPPLSTTSSGSSPSTQWARVSPAAPHHDTRPAELVRSTTHCLLAKCSFIRYSEIHTRKYDLFSKTEEITDCRRHMPEGFKS